MLSSSDSPTSLRSLLTTFRLSFTGPSFITFSALVRGFIAGVGENTVCGLLTGAGLAEVWHHSRAHHFFSRRRWSAQRLGLQLASLIVTRLLAADAPIEIAVDDTLFKRSGKRVFGARWCHDGTAVGPRAIGFGNCFIVAGIAVMVPICRRVVCFPVLFSLWLKGPKVAVARDLVLVLAQHFPGRQIHVSGDAAYVSRDLRGLPAQITWTTRARANAVFHDLTPPRTGKRGRPRLRGERLPSLTGLAERLHWAPTTVTRYGSGSTVHIAHRRLLWYHPFGTQTVRLVLVRETRTTTGYDVALITTDLAASATAIVERYATRWSIEVAFEDAKQITGVGEARNRTEAAVRRTVPFGFISQGIVMIWYITELHHDDVVEQRRRRSPWYRTKDTPSTADMLVTARRVLIAGRFSPTRYRGPSPSEIDAVTHAWALAAA